MNSTFITNFAQAGSSAPGIDKSMNKSLEVRLDNKSGEVRPFSQFLKENGQKDEPVKAMEKLMNLLKLSAEKQKEELEKMDAEELAALQKLIASLLSGQLKLPQANKMTALKEQLLQLNEEIKLSLVKLAGKQKQQLQVKLQNNDADGQKLDNDNKISSDAGEKGKLLTDDKKMTNLKANNEERPDAEKNSAAILRQFLKNKESESLHNLPDQLKKMIKEKAAGEKGIAEHLRAGIEKTANLEKDTKINLTKFMDFNQGEKLEGKELFTPTDRQSNGEQFTFMNQSNNTRFSHDMAGQPTGQQVKQADILNQITEQMKLFNRSKNELEMQLEPDFLGKVRIKLKVEAGEVTAKFIVDNLAVKNNLEQSLQGLRQSLIKQGMHVDQINVETNNYHNPDQQQEQGQQFHQQQEQGHKQRHYSFDQEQLAELSIEELEELLEGNLEGLPDVDLSNLSLNQRQWFIMNRYQRMDLLA